ASAFLTGWIAARHGLRPAPFVPGVIFVALGLMLTSLCVRDTRALGSLEAAAQPNRGAAPRSVFWETTLRNRNLASVTQVGLVNNLNDGMAWGLFPLVFVNAGLDLAHVGILTAIYPGTWGLGQLATGVLSDRIGRKRLIVGGMWVQAAAIAIVTLS